LKDDLFEKKRKSEKRYFDTDLLETVEEVFDRQTILTLFDLMRSRCIKEIKGVISTGKEARVYWGTDYENREIAIKIYYTLTAEFRRSIWKYLSGDPRYEDLRGLDRRRLIYVWAGKEYSNLKRMIKAGVRVPEPYCRKNNILVMQFLGENGERYPLLKEAYENNMLTKKDLELIYQDVLNQIIIMIEKARLIHADLSEYNIMVKGSTPYIIDVSQAVSIDHVNAIDFLRHDLDTINRFFAEAGVDIEYFKDLYNKIFEVFNEYSIKRV